MPLVLVFFSDLTRSGTKSQYAIVFTVSPNSAKSSCPSTSKLERLPPWPFRRTIRRNPWWCSEAQMSCKTSMKTLARKVMEPGKSMWCAETPVQMGRHQQDLGDLLFEVLGQTRRNHNVNLKGQVRTVLFHGAHGDQSDDFFPIEVLHLRPVQLGELHTFFTPARDSFPTEYRSEFYVNATSRRSI